MRRLFANYDPIANFALCSRDQQILNLWQAMPQIKKVDVQRLNAGFHLLKFEKEERDRAQCAP